MVHHTTPNQATAPVSHQKRAERTTTNAIEINQNRSKINEGVLYPPAHNGLVEGSNPAGPTIATKAYGHFVARPKNAATITATDACLICSRVAVPTAASNVLPPGRSKGRPILKKGCAASDETHYH